MCGRSHLSSIISPISLRKRRAASDFAFLPRYSLSFASVYIAKSDD